MKGSRRSSFLPQQQADPSGFDDPASAATSDPEVQHPSTNPHPGHIEQSENFRAMPRLHRRDGSEEKGADVWHRVSWRLAVEKEEDRKTALQVGPKTRQETLPAACILEPVAREAPSADSGHAWGKAWPLQVRASHREEGRRRMKKAQKGKYKGE
ncbi:hypothetical protein NDU88_005730 [Pleurodeles waltl]|uniref:Uncharacterized protein n=1 Tax=Pleurodeles waltl TaxID=8319 RepID=A0AAV7WBH9_PLEWA|nr:hypothetical protein NDU88_005730 [Pleurodeles waltl]